MKNKSKIKKIIAAVFLAFFVVGMLIVYAGYKKVDNTVKLVNQQDKEIVKSLVNSNISETTKSRLKENWTVAIFGIDSRKISDLSGSNSDVIILASINNKTGNITLVSVYRDTCLKTGQNRYKKVNEAYAMGGPKKAIEVLNENLDLEIDDYIAVNWSAVATTINILGGIDIDITNEELKYINSYITETVNCTGIGSVQLKESGMQHLDGVQAVAYSRIRYTSGNDFKRTERQRDILTALLSKAKRTDWATLNNVIVTVFPTISSSIDTEDVIEMAMNLLKYNFTKNSGFPFKLSTRNVDKQDFVFPDTLENNVMELHSYMYGVENHEVSDAVKLISVKIEEKHNGKFSYEKKSEYIEETYAEVNEAEFETEPEPEIILEIEIETEKITDVNPENYGPGYVIHESKAEPEITKEVDLGIETESLTIEPEAVE